MLRYVHIGSQIEDDANQFSFYDTVTDEFIGFTVYNTCVFDSWDDFLEWYKPDEYPRHPLDRFEALMPKK